MIPVIINNRNLLTWPKAMVEKLQTLDNVGEIFIIDNGSTYEPLLEWYKTNPCTIIWGENLGHRAPWECGLVDKLSTPYVVTDPDLGIESLPKDTLNVLNQKLQNNPHLGKIGLSLEWETIPQGYPYYNHLQDYEKTRWEQSEVEDGVYVDVHIDTTFALYNTKSYFIGGGSLPFPYTARHIPWEYNETQRNEDQEFSFYLNNASSSSSYKVYLNL